MKLQWLKLDIDILDDNKIDAIRSLPEGDALFVLWIGLLCMAMKSANFGHVYIAEGIPYTADALSRKLKIKESVIKLGLNMFVEMGMIQITEGGIIDILNFEKHQSLEKLEYERELNRKRVAKHRDKYKEIECNALRNDDVMTQIRLDKTRLEENREEKTAQAPKPSVFHSNLELEQFRNTWNQHDDKFNKFGEWTESLAKQYYAITKGKHVPPNDLLMAVGKYANKMSGSIKAVVEKFLLYNKVFEYLPEKVVPVRQPTPAERQANEKQRTDEAFENSIIDKRDEILEYFGLNFEIGIGQKAIDNLKKRAEFIDKVEAQIKTGNVEYKKYKTIDDFLGGK